MECRNECAIPEINQRCHVAVHSVYGVNSVWRVLALWLMLDCQKSKRNSVWKWNTKNFIRKISRIVRCQSGESYIWWWLVQWSVSAGSESNESGVALRDRVPVLDVSMSRNTSRMSGLREWRDLVRPRTVRFNALTRCFTASAWDLGRPATLDFNSFVDNSRPYKWPRKQFPLVFIYWFD